MQLAVRGDRGYGEMLDHTGKRVVTSWTYLPSFRWGLTVKQDADEAFELLRQQRQVVGLFMAVAGLAVFASPGGWRGRSRGRSARRPRWPSGSPRAT